MSIIKKLISFRWLLSGVYLAALLIQVLGIVSGAGHAPRSLRFLFYVVAWPSYLFDLLLPRVGMLSPLVGLILFLVIGLLTYWLLGFLIDIAIQKYRKRHV